MHLAQVIGHCTTTIRHRSFAGQRLLIVQPLTGDGRPDGDPQIAVDGGQLGADAGQQVVISSDGKGTAEMVRDTTTPIRWAVLGIVDPVPGKRSRA